MTSPAPVFPPPLQRMPAYRKLFGPTHRRQAAAARGDQTSVLRDQDHWPKYFNTEINNFIRKRGNRNFVLNGRSVKAIDLYRRAYDQRTITVPKGKFFNYDTGRLINARKLHGDEYKEESDRDSDTGYILYKGAAGPQADAIEEHEVGEGPFTLTIEYFGHRNTEDSNVGGRNCEPIIEYIRGTTLPRVIFYCLKRARYEGITRDQIRGFMKKPKVATPKTQGTRYYRGSDDWHHLLGEVVPEDKQPQAVSRYRIALVVGLESSAPHQGIPQHQIANGSYQVSQILSHRFTTTAMNVNKGILQFISTAPFATNNDCNELVCIQMKGDGYAKKYGHSLSKELLNAMWGTENGIKKSVQQILPFFEELRLGLTVLNVAGEVIFEYTPSSRNSKLGPNSRLFAVQHCNHLYAFDRSKKSFENTVFPKPTNKALTKPSTWFKTPPQTEYQHYVPPRDYQGNKSLIDQLQDVLAKYTHSQPLVATAEAQKDAEHVKISYGGSIEDLFNWFRLTHSFEPQIFVKENMITALVLNLVNVRISISECGSSVGLPEDYSAWMNKFKRAMFHPEMKSIYTENDKRVFASCRKAQLYGAFRDDANEKEVGVDRCRMYTHAAMQFSHVPVFLLTDDYQQYAGEPIEDYNCYIVQSLSLAWSQVDGNDGWPVMSEDTTERFILNNKSFNVMWGFTLKRCGLEFKIHAVKTPSHLVRNPFKDIVEELYKSDADEDIKKLVPLHCIGMLGKTRASHEQGYFTTDIEEAVAIAGDANRVMSLKNLGGYIALRKSEEVQLNDGFYAFQSLVYDIARLSMLEDYRACVAQGIRVFAINTDCLYVDRLPETDYAEREVGADGKKVHLRFEQIGQHRTEEADLVPKKRLDFEANVNPVIIQPQAQFQKLEKLQEGLATLVVAWVAGAGKTTASLWRTQADKEVWADKTLVVVPTNLQVERIEKEYGCDAITVDKFLGNRITEAKEVEKTGKTYDITKYKRVVLDELYQSSLPSIVKMLEIVKKHPAIWWLANGDSFQNTNAEQLNNLAGGRSAYLEKVLPRYFSHRIFLETSYRLKCPEHKNNSCGCARLLNERQRGRDLRDALGAGMTIADAIRRFNFKTFSDVKSFHGVKKAVTYTNATAHCLNQIIHNSDAIGMRVMAKEYHKELITGKTYEVKRLHKEYYILDINGEELAFRKNMFRLSYSITCHCSQGDTFVGRYGVFDATCSFADREWFYTAVTRCEYWDDVLVYVGPALMDYRSLGDKLSGYKRDDEAKGRKYDLTMSYVMKLCKEANYCCAICHDRVQMMYEPGDEKQAVLDRKNNDLGHCVGNVRLACMACNRTLGDHADPRKHKHKEEGDV